MNKKDLSQLTDKELMLEATRRKKAAIINAILIGFLFGIVFYSAMNNTLGLVTLIPLFFVYKIVNASKYDKDELERQLKERKLK